MPWWGWMIIGALLFGSELLIVDAGFYLVFLGIAAALTGLVELAGLGLEPWLQWVLFSVIALLYAQLPARRTKGAAILWPGKTDRTFSDAITAVRRWLWCEWAFATPGHHVAFSKLSRPIRAVLLYALAPAA